MTESGLSVGFERMRSLTTTFRKVSGLTLATGIEVSGPSPDKIERCSPTPRHPAGAGDMQRERRPRPIIAFPAIIGYSRKPRTRRIVPFWDSFCLAGKARRCRSRQNRVLVRAGGATKGAQQRAGR
jgi:hypothetical protein